MLEKRRSLGIHGCLGTDQAFTNKCFPYDTVIKLMLILVFPSKSRILAVYRWFLPGPICSIEPEFSLKYFSQFGKYFSEFGLCLSVS